LADQINGYFKRFYPPQHKIAAAQPRSFGMGCVFRPVEGYSNTFPAMTCRDGFSMSVQGHAGTYSQPRDDWADEYSMVEVGFPSEREDLLMPYAEEPEAPTDTVYGYVPISVVESVIEKHGGLLATPAA
jgi:hypothetical protein